MPVGGLPSSVVADGATLGGAGSLFNGTTFDRPRGVSGAAEVTGGGRSTTAVAAATAGNTVIKASAGRLCKILVTTVGANPLQVFDSPTTNAGTIIGMLAASAPVGTVLSVEMPALTGITVAGSATNPGVTISFD